MGRTTIKDIARLLSVAPSTVSRALADHPDISDGMKSRVHATAGALGYIPNARARNLRTQFSKLIALVLPEMNTFFVPSLMSGINSVLTEHDYSLVVFQSNDSIVQERRLLKLCLSLALDGVLLVSSSETTELRHVDRLAEVNTPVVLIDKILATKHHSTAAIDDVASSQEATEYLFARGHRRILGIFGDDRLGISNLRLEGFRRAHTARGLSMDPQAVLNVANLTLFEERFDALLSTNKAATAIFVMSDELLVRTHHAVMARGLAIPGDVSIIAISDGYAPYFLHPNITHLLDSGAVMGKKAAHILMELMAHADTVADTRLRTPLVELQSVKNLTADSSDRNLSD